MVVMIKSCHTLSTLPIAGPIYATQDILREFSTRRALEGRTPKEGQA
jgi:hypothetical protein